MLLGVDFNARDKPSALRRGYHLDSLIDRLGVSKAAIVIIDACRNNPFAQSVFRSVRGSSRDLPSGGMNPEIKSSGGVYVVFSTSKGDVA